MNHSYCLVWNDATERYVAAPETARSRGKSRAAKTLAPALLLLGAMLVSAAGAQNLPKEGAVITGQARIDVNGNQLTVTQTGQKAILQWQSFDIGRGNTVRFIQPNAHAVALNRVVGVGSAPSQIDGQLSANGQLVLVNPNGVVFGRGSQVNVGGLVASTMNITDKDFNDNKAIFTRGAAKGGISNQGNIKVADRGMLALLAREVKNDGTLTAQRGNVVLAGGDRVMLQAGAQGKLQVMADPSTVRTLIENQGMIVADGGTVVMTAHAANMLSGAMVSNTGTVQARTLENQQGRILLSGNMVSHSNRLDASAPHGGNGGSIETSATFFKLEAGAKVDATASSGNTGDWRIVGKHLNIQADNAGSIRGISANMLSENLETTRIDVAMRGDLSVNAPISYGRNGLVLDARNTLSINAPISVKGTGRLDLNYGRDAIDPFDLDMKFLVRAPVNFERAGANILQINNYRYEVINDLVGLQSINAMDKLGGNYALGRTIDASASAIEFVPIGKREQPFHGSFDGLGHSIKNLTIQHPNLSGVGLFGVANNAVLRNVGLSQMQVHGAEAVGGLVGSMQSNGGRAHICNVHVDAKVTGNENVGGLAGANHAHRGGTARVSRSTSIGQVVGIRNVGGLVGFNVVEGGEAIISDSNASGPVSGNQQLGGLVGENLARSGTAQIERVVASGTVTGANAFGTLIGLNQSAEGTTMIKEAHGPVTGKPIGMVRGKFMISQQLTRLGRIGALIPVASSAQGVPAASSAQGVPAASSAQDMPAASSAQAVPAASSAQGVPAASSAQGMPAASLAPVPVPIAPGNANSNKRPREALQEIEERSTKLCTGSASASATSNAASAPARPASAGPLAVTGPASAAAMPDAASALATPDPAAVHALLELKK